MTAWTSDELDKIGKEEELDIISLRCEGTMRKPVTIWVVRVGDDLYVRAFKGREGPWFRWTRECQEGVVKSAGVEKEVRFIDEVAPGINDRIDAEYRRKYGHHPAIYVDPMVTLQAREATLKLVPKRVDQ